MKKAVRQKRPGYFTLKIIRGTAKNTFNIRMPKTLVNVLFSLLATFLLFILIMTFKTGSLSSEYKGRLKDIEKLKDINVTQQQEINTLNNITDKVRDKLRSLKDTKTKIGELVGIDE